jgi:aspartyl-tRNA(Asn)/glutamyl-tRNA(Gln) amidotransferase subunit C
MISIKDIEKLATLGRLKINDTEKESLRKDIDSILGYVGEIQKVDIGDASTKVELVRNVMREDGNAHQSGKYTEALLSSAPDREGDYVKVKKIL